MSYSLAPSKTKTSPSSSEAMPATRGDGRSSSLTLNCCLGYVGLAASVADLGLASPDPVDVDLVARCPWMLIVDRRWNGELTTRFLVRVAGSVEPADGTGHLQRLSR